MKSRMSNPDRKLNHADNQLTGRMFRWPKRPGQTHACHLNDKVAIFLTPFRLFVKKSGFNLTYVRYRAKFIATMTEIRQMDQPMKLNEFLSQHAVFTMDELDRFLSARGSGKPNTRKSLLTYYRKRGRIIPVRRHLLSITAVWWKVFKYPSRMPAICRRKPSPSHHQSGNLCPVHSAR